MSLFSLSICFVTETVNMWCCIEKTRLRNRCAPANFAKVFISDFSENNYEQLRPQLYANRFYYTGDSLTEYVTADINS